MKQNNETLNIVPGQLCITDDLQIKEYTPESEEFFELKQVSAASEIQTLFDDLIVIFDEMGFEPINLSSNPEQEIKNFKEKMIKLKKEVYELEIRYADIQFQNSIYEKICKSK